MSTASGDLWEFSLKLYAEPGVAASCLSLQDQHGFDVNLVLFCIWYGCRHGELTDDLLKTASKLGPLARNSSALAKPAYPLKRDLKESAYSSSSEISVLRDRIKTAELDAERIQQQELEKLIEQSVKKTCFCSGRAFYAEKSRQTGGFSGAGLDTPSAAISTTSSS